MSAIWPVLGLLLSVPASANTVQDQLGLGSRAKSMGGAGTAIANDPSATYYNPAGLTNCEQNQASVEVGHLVYGIGVDSADARASDAELSDRSAVTIGACLHLPYRLSVGLIFDTGLQQAQRLKQKSLHPAPEFALYGQPLEQISMMGAISMRVSEKLSLGLGGAVLVNSALGLSVQVPVIAAEEELATDIAWDLQPTASLYAGVQYRATSKLQVAASLRTALYHKLKGEAFTTVDVAGVLIDVDLLLESVAWYSPLQAAAGVAYQLSRGTTVTADLTWYHWSAYPGPYIHISPLDPNDTVAAGLNYPPDEDPNFSDIFVPRVGAEIALSPGVELRGGLAYRPTPAPLPPPDQRATLLDSATASASLGAGYRWNAPAAKPLSSGSAERGAAVSTGLIELHARVHHMSERRVAKLIAGENNLDFRFGGLMFDAGLTLTVGW